MEGWTIALLAVGVLELFVAGLAVIGMGFLWWTVRSLDPHTELAKRVSDAELAVHTLGNQVTKLRTSKAGRASAERRAAEPEPEPADEEDAFLAELSPQDRALWMAIPKEQRLKAQVD